MKIKNVITTWKDAVSLLAWKELKLLLLASLNNFRRSIKLTIKHFWWLWAAWLTLLVLPTFFNTIVTPHPLFDAIILEKASTIIMPYHLPIFSCNFWTIMSTILMFGIVSVVINFTNYLSTRASVEAKNSTYYRGYFAKIGYFFIAQSVAGLILAPIAFVATLFTVNLTTTIITNILFSLPILVGYIFLDLENAKILQIVRKGVVLFVHFLPLFLVFSFLNVALLFLLYGAAVLLLSCVVSPIVVVCLILGVSIVQTLVFWLFTLSCFATLYIKIKHAHPNLFFA